MDNTRARVEVCNAPTYSGSKRCELQVPTARSDNSIAATFRRGYLAPARSTCRDKRRGQRQSGRPSSHDSMMEGGAFAIKA